ncbi:thiamine diphosphokinase [Lagierella sp.]|uniref:thiamine diphosphokinase n=1 Tax=Lagierella sp. TaxID=2849657 RepID=UPI0026245D14|nr:thiamine diphosphokinase [Lagierella sp.]
MKGTIVTGGNLIDASLLLKYTKKSDLIIGVDKGVELLVNNNISMDYALGDFDSIIDKSLLKSKNIEKVLTLNPIKDVSDTHAAVELAIERKAKIIYILSGIGSRMDHTLSNVSLLKRLYELGIEGFIIDNNNRIRYGKNVNEIDREYDYVSVIPLEDGVKVTTEGFFYKTEQLNLEYSQSRFLSNVLNKGTGLLEIEGSALIIESRD